MKPDLQLLRSWIPGLLIAGLGIAGVRLIAPALEGRLQAWVSVVSYVLVPLGLGLIARCIYRRAEQRSLNEAAEAPPSGG